jgi:hypothetical protein
VDRLDLAAPGPCTPLPRQPALTSHGPDQSTKQAIHCQCGGQKAGNIRRINQKDEIARFLSESAGKLLKVSACFSFA